MPDNPKQRTLRTNGDDRTEEELQIFYTYSVQFKPTDN